ncbi:LuxR C-terminal-related transcriptional regulator [Panacagrimonas sp.]|uniref:LuxR C-terminal-related transcriptional regulator n=1 Tax=Panacagrimonas sp. TaxID=2480088 RepID=UPI003B52E1FF
MVWQQQPSWTTNATKLVPPKQRLQLLDREALAREADDHIDRRLLLISAPAGYGKTSTLIQLHERLKARHEHVAWLSLDADDNDIVRFLAHLVDAIARTGLNLSTRPEALLGSRAGAQQGPGSTPPASTLRTELLNELALVRDEVFVFLDDFHLIRDAGVLDLVGTLLLAPLDHVHFVIATREAPDLPVARLRALGAMHEIDVERLAFSLPETEAFVLATGGVTLNPAQVGELLRKTEGWPASLQMALIAMRKAGDLDAFLASFSGADRSIASFLVDEVLKTQSPAAQEFLLVTSLLTRFNTGLANALLERRDAREMIDHLETHNLFVFSLDRDRNWYRYHHLFGELLRQRLADTQPDLVVQIHARACDWLAANGHAIEAIEHAFAMGNMERAGELIDAVSGGLFASAQTATLSAFASRLPPELLRRLPRLQLEVVWENIIRWRFDEARASLDDIRGQLGRTDTASTLPDAEVAALRTKLAHRDVMMETFTDQLDAVLRSGRAWIAEHGVRNGFMGLSVATAMMMARREALNAELTPSEWESLRSQYIEARAIYGTVFLDAVVGQTLFLRGNLTLAEQALRQGHATAVRLHGEGSNFAAMPGCALGWLLYERNEIDAASQLIDRFRDVPAGFGLADSVMARAAAAARMAAARGDFSSAHRALDETALVAARHSLTRLHPRIAYERIRLHLADGRPQEAERLANDDRYREGFAHTAPGRQPNSTKLYYALAAAELAGARGDTSSAMNLLRAWLGVVRERGCSQHAITLLVLLTRLQHRAGETLAARRSLIEALRLGAHGGFRRSFLDGGSEIASVLRDIRETRPGPELCSTDYLAQIFSDFDLDTGSASPLSVPRTTEPEEPATLSPKEIEVLQLSANHLVAREVAQQLGVAETTVKWYWRRIFSKLGVHRRAAAVRVAQQRGLIR